VAQALLLYVAQALLLYVAQALLLYVAQALLLYAAQALLLYVAQALLPVLDPFEILECRRPRLRYSILRSAARSEIIALIRSSSAFRSRRSPDHARSPDLLNPHQSSANSSTPQPLADDFAPDRHA
jgi:hypothetical protein